MEKFYNRYYSGFLPEGLNKNSSDDFNNFHLKEIEKIVQESKQALEKNGSNEYNEKIRTIIISATIERARIIQNLEGAKSLRAFEILEKVYLENKQYLKDYKTKKMDPLYLCKSGELIAVYMGYLNVFKIINLAGKVNELQKTSLKTKTENFCAYSNLGVGAYFAPVIAGGGMNKALNYLMEADKYATSDYQKYGNLVWISQAYFKKKKLEKANEYLLQASSIFPGGFFHKDALEKNRQGKAL